MKRTLREDVIWIMTQFWQENHFDYKKDARIVDIKVKKFLFRKIINILIMTERPGLLIGKHGKFINDLKIELEKELKKKVNIDLKETNIWKGECYTSDFDTECDIFDFDSHHNVFDDEH